MFSLCVGDAEVIIDQREDSVKLSFCDFKTPSEVVKGTLTNVKFDYFKSERAFVVSLIALEDNGTEGHCDVHVHAWLLNYDESAIDHITHTYSDKVPDEDHYLVAEINEAITHFETYIRNRRTGESSLAHSFKLVS